MIVQELVSKFCTVFEDVNCHRSVARSVGHSAARLRASQPFSCLERKEEKKANEQRNAEFRCRKSKDKFVCSVCPKASLPLAILRGLWAWMRRRAAEVSTEQQRASRELRLLRRRSAGELVRLANGNREVPAAAPREGRVLRVTAVAVEPVIPGVVVLAEPEEVEVQSERETVCRLIICCCECWRIW